MTPDQHAATVREKIRLLHSDAHYEEADEALLALVTLAERATQLETALDVQKESARVLETQRDHWLETYKREHSTRHAMEDTIKAERERAERAERELAELNRALEIPRQYDVLLGEWKDRAERAETALREHLDIILSCVENPNMNDRERCQMVKAAVADARAALGETAPTGEEPC